jgi:peptidoglycan/LPS O-acetylase OafA/YrhL
MVADTDSGGRYVFLDYLRAAAAWLVVWDHLATIMPGWAGVVFAPAQWVRNNITGPLGIIQDFGWFGVALFFLISGFIISDRARVETAYEFVVRRVLRIYPMLAVAVLLAAAFVATRSDVTPRNVLLNLTLANYVVIPQVVLLGVAWTLVIEMIFYALTAATQFARDSPHRIAINLVFAALVIWKRGMFGASFSLFAVSVGYLPILVMGQTVYWWLGRKRLSAVWGLGYLAAACGVFLLGVRAIHPELLPASNSYLISVGYALLAFVILMHAQLPARRVVRFLSDTSYSMYLLHGIVGALILKALLHRLPTSIAILAAAAGSLAASYLTYRLVERPSQRLGRHLTHARKPAPVAVAAG